MGSHRVGHNWSDLAAAAAARDPNSSLWCFQPHWFLFSGVAVERLKRLPLITRAGNNLPPHNQGWLVVLETLVGRLILQSLVEILLRKG